MNLPAEELAELLARCALRDRASFERLYKATSAQLFGLILRIVRNQELASEVLQEGYVKIWNRAGDFRLEKAKPMTWMGAIVRNQAIDFLRRAAHQPIDADPVDELPWLADEDSLGPMEAAYQSQQNEALQRCLAQLEGDQRQAMLLAYFHGMTHDELAVHMGKPLGTVKSWLRRGLQRLKKCLEAA